MPVRELLKSVVDRVEGGLGIVVMDFDGIPIDEHFVEGGADIHVMAVEYISFLKEIRSTAEVLKSGRLDEVSVATEKWKVIIRIINEDLFVMLCIAAGGNYGKGRYLLLKAAPELRAALG